MLPKHSLITIGITCHNAADTISRALNSAREQDWPNIEILVVDDCSEDSSVEVINNHTSSDKRIKLLQHTVNKGYPSALNTIVDNAKGEYIAFFDDDDDSLPNRITAQYNRLLTFKQSSRAEEILCYSHRCVFTDGIEKSEAFVTAIGHTPNEPHGPMVADYLLWNRKLKGYAWGEFGSGTLMSSRTLLKKYTFDPNFRRSAEWDLAIRVALQGGYFISVDEPLVIQHKTPTPDKAGSRPLKYTLQLRRKHKKYLKKNHVYLGAVLQAYARFYYFRQEKWRSRICFVLACLLSPSKILVPEILKRIGTFTSEKGRYN